MELIKLVGTPFEKMDCFHVAREAYYILNNYKWFDTSVEHTEKEKVNQLFQFEKTKWHKVECQKGAVVAIRFDPKLPKIVTHFGVMIDNNKMIHTTENTGCVIEPISKYLKLVEGFYKHTL